MNYVVNSADMNPTYVFFIPIVNAIWRRHIGYEPITILVRSGDIPDWLMSYVERDTSVMVHLDEVPGFRISSVAQTSRVTIASDSRFHDDDYILTSDADMIPLSHRFFNSQCGTKCIHLLNADAYADISKGYDPPKYPICYIGAVVRAWREFMTLTSHDNQAEITKALTGRVDHWGNDEEYVSGKLMGSRFYKQDCQLLYRGGFAECSRAKDRIDRDCWWFDGSKNFIDCHCKRPGHHHIELLSKVLRVFFPEEMPYFEQYFAEYVAKVA